MIDLNKVKVDNINYGALKIYEYGVELQDEGEFMLDSQVKNIFKRRFDLLKINLYLNEVFSGILSFNKVYASEEKLVYSTGVDDEEKLIKLTIEKSLQGELNYSIDEVSIEGGGGGGSDLSVHEFDLYVDDPSQPFNILTPEQMEDIWENEYDILKVNAHINIDGGLLVKTIFERVQVVEGMAITYVSGADPEQKITQISIMNNGGTLSYDMTEIPLSGGSGSNVSGTNDGINWTSITINGEKYGIPQGGHDIPYEANLIIDEQGIAYMTQEDLDYIHTNKPGVVVVHQEQDGHDIAQTFAFSGYMTIDGSAYGRMTYQLLGENKSAFLVALPVNASDPVATMDFVYATTDQVNAKQDALVSGTNIKTIDGNSLVGAGNINTKEKYIVNLLVDTDTGKITMSQEDIDYLYSVKPSDCYVVSPNPTYGNIKQIYELVGYIEIGSEKQLVYKTLNVDSTYSSNTFVAIPKSASTAIEPFTQKLATCKSVTPTSVNMSTDPFAITIQLSREDCADIFNNKYNFVQLLTESQLGINITCARQANSNEVVGYFAQFDTGTEVYYYSFALTSIAVYDNVTKRIDTPELAKVATSGDYEDLSNKPTIPDAVSPWKGKVISIMGDSISTFQGWIPVNDGHNLDHAYYYPQTGLTKVNQTWWHKLINDLGAKLGINESWSGSYVGNTLDADISAGGGNKYGKKACMAGNTRIENLGANGTPDLILVYGGTNDLWSGNNKFGEVVPGTFDSTQNYDVSQSLLDTNTWASFAEAFRDMIRKMMYYYPKSKIVVLFPFYSDSNAAYSNAQLDAFIEVQREICDYFGINYIDLRACGINAGNIKASANRKGFTTILVGNVHPNEAGMTLMKDYIKAKLLSFFDTNKEETVVYTVTNNLSVNTNKDEYIKGVSAGESYMATITGSNLGLVKVYMDGTDVTSTVYNSSTGIINIASVTGNINIAEAELQSYTITTNVINGSASGDSSIMTGGTATITITPSTDYALPVSVSVSGAIYSYNSSMGVITLSNPTDNVTISVTCVALETYSITANVTNGSYSGDATIVQGRTAQVTLSPDSGYLLPDSITVSGATYSYDSSTGVISLSDPTGNVTITAVCTVIPVSYSITTSVTNGIYSGATSIYDGQTAQVIIAANINHALPSSITVSGADYSYDSSTGEINLSNPTGNVTISAECGERGWFSSNYNANDAAHRTGEAKVNFAGFAYKAGVYDGDGVKMNAVRFVLKHAGTLTVGKVAADFKSVTDSETVTVTGSDGDAKEIQLSKTYTLENGEHFFISMNTDTCTFQYSNSSNSAPNGQKNFYLYAGTAQLDAGNRPTEVLSVDFGYFETAL